MVRFVVRRELVFFLHEILPIDLVASLLSFLFLDGFFGVLSSSFIVVLIVLDVSQLPAMFERLLPLLLPLQHQLSFTFDFDRGRGRWIVDEIEHETVGDRSRFEFG